MLPQSSMLWKEQPANGHYPVGLFPTLGFRISDSEPTRAVAREFFSVASVEYWHLSWLWNPVTNERHFWRDSGKPLTNNSFAETRASMKVSDYSVVELQR
jgi:hypothetical protein